MASLQELLSKGANQKTRSAVAQAETAIGIMRKSGYIPQAEEFESRIRNSIVNKNGEAFGGTLKQLYAFQKKAPIATPETKEQPPEYGSEELAMRIQDTLSLADERVVDLPNSSLARLSSFVAKGDTKKASQQLGEISTFIEKAIDTQTKETKKTQSFRDGTQIQVGDQSGIRYMGGQPVSKGAINSDVFNSMYQKNAVTQQEQFAEAGVPMVSSIPLEPSQQYQVAPVEGVVAQPEIYAQAIKPEGETEIPKATQYITKARESYINGDIQGAIDILNGTNLASVYSGIDKSNIADILGLKPLQQNSNSTQPPDKNQIPPLESILGQ